MHVLLSIPGGISVRGAADWNDRPDYVCMGLNPIMSGHKVSCGCNIVELEVMMACISAPRICKCPCQFSHVLCLQFPCDCHEMTGSGYGAKWTKERKRSFGSPLGQLAPVDLWSMFSLAY